MQCFEERESLGLSIKCLRRDISLAFIVKKLFAIEAKQEIPDLAGCLHRSFVRDERWIRVSDTGYAGFFVQRRRDQVTILKFCNLQAELAFVHRHQFTRSAAFRV